MEILLQLNNNQLIQFQDLWEVKVQLSPKTSGIYDSKNIGTSKTITVSVAEADYSAGGSTSLDNYTLDTGIVTRKYWNHY